MTLPKNFVPAEAVRSRGRLVCVAMCAQKWRQCQLGSSSALSVATSAESLMSLASILFADPFFSISQVSRWSSSRRPSINYVM